MLLPSKPLYLLHPLSPLQRSGISSLSPATSTLWPACPARVNIGLMFPPKHTITIWGQLARSGRPSSSKSRAEPHPCKQQGLGAQVWQSLRRCLGRLAGWLRPTRRGELGGHVSCGGWATAAGMTLFMICLIDCTEERETKIWSFVLFNYKTFCL